MATLNNMYTKAVEPITHIASGNRAKSVFRIHDTNIMNVTLTKIGLYNTTVTDAMGYSYLPIGGVNALLSGGDLYDADGNLLDSFRTKARTLTVNKFLGVNNRTAEDIMRVKKLGSYSFRENDELALVDVSDNTVDYSDADADGELQLLTIKPIGEQYTNYYTNGSGEYVQTARNAIHITATSDSSEGQAGEIDLKEVFPMLGSLPDVGGLGHLEIVLYFNTNVEQVLSVGGGGGLTTGWAAKRPLMLYEVQPGANVEDIQSAVYLSPIVSTYPLDDFSSSLGTQVIEVKNVAGKFVDHIDLLVVNTADFIDNPQLPEETYFHSLKNLQVQIRLDDIEDLLPTSLSNPSDLAMHRLLAKGEQLIPFAGYWGSGIFRNDVSYNTFDESCEDLYGNMGPLSFNIKRRVIDKLTIELTSGGSVYTDLQLIVVPHVIKQLTRKGDTPIIQFV